MNNTTNITTSTTSPPLPWQIAQAVASTAIQTDTFFLFMMASVIVLMQFGFGLFEAGVSRSSFTIKRSLIKNFLCTMLAMIAFWGCGYAVMYGGSNCVAGALIYWAFWQMPTSLYAHFWMQFAYAATSVNIALGAIAERGHMAAYLVFAFLWAGFSEPVVAHWVWYPTGFLLTVCGQPFVQPGANVTFIPFQDMSGASVVHLTGGTAGLFGAVLCGARTDRFDHVSGELNTYRPHSVTLALIGSALMTFGMLALNTVGQVSINITPGVLAALTMINTMLSAAVAAFTVYFILLCARSKASLTRIASGAIAGMVSVASDANNVTTWSACIFGFFAGVTYLFWVWVLQKGKVDDVTDAFATFGGPAMWGLIGTAFLDNTNGIIHSNMQSLWYLAMQCAGVGAVVGWAAITSVLIFGILRLARVIRVSEELEMKGVEHFLHYQPQAQDNYALGLSQLAISSTHHRTNSTMQYRVIH